MALEWSDVDLAKRQMTVARSEWKGHVTATKGERLRHAADEAADEALRGAASTGPRVLCEGAAHTEGLQVLMRRAARRANVKPGVHILRHTFCSHLAMRGAPARAIQELAGHQDLTTTQRYMHLSPAASTRPSGSWRRGPSPAVERLGKRGGRPGRRGRRPVVKKVVEAAGVEPASERTSSQDSTCVSASWFSRPPCGSG